jgi:cytochrome d ubiquinol oxidase subunit I
MDPICPSCGGPLRQIPEDQWPDNIPLLYYSYHIMVGLGTFFIAAMGIASLLLLLRRLHRARWMLWILMLAIPFPFIANTAGWMPRLGMARG